MNQKKDQKNLSLMKYLIWMIFDPKSGVRSTKRRLKIVLSFLGFSCKIIESVPTPNGELCLKKLNYFTFHTRTLYTEILLNRTFLINK